MSETHAGLLLLLGGALLLFLLFVAFGQRRRLALLERAQSAAEDRLALATETAEAAAAARVTLLARLEEAGSRADALRRECNELAGMIDSLPRPVWRRDPELKLAFVNRAFAEAVGLPREEVLARSIELVDGPNRAQALALAAAARDEGRLQCRSFHAVLGGRRCLLELTELPLGDGSLLGHARDLTAWEETKTELSRHIEAHRAVLEKLSVGIAIFSADAQLVFHNQAYAQIWRLEERFLESQPRLPEILEALREQRRLPEQADFAEFKRQQARLLQGLLEPLEELAHLPDGTTLRVTAQPHPFGGVVYTYEDVTDRLRLERTYNTLLEVQRATLDHLYEGVAVYGADGRLQLFNQAFAQIWHLPESLLQERPHARELLARCREFFPVEEAAWPDYVDFVVARATEPEPRSGRRELAGGALVDWRQVPLPDGASLFTFLDVTDATRVERALRERNEALEATDRLKSEFIANVSYELRTPLNAIIGFAEILENEYFGKLNERQREYSRAIIESSQRLVALINDILDLASIEAGYLELELQEVDIHRLLTAAQALWRERARAHGLKLTLDCPQDIGSFLGDERRMNQALFNLLSNAFKFTGEGGEITVSASAGPADESQEITIRISDNGIGIAPEDQVRVFGRFERGGNLEGAAGRQSGAGLGLSLVKSLIELHGGHIELNSAPGRGTSMALHLPRGGSAAGENLGSGKAAAR